MGEDGLNPGVKVRFKCHFCRVVGSVFYGHEANWRDVLKWFIEFMLFGSLFKWIHMSLSCKEHFKLLKYTGLMKF